MELTPEQASRLADLLLDSSAETAPFAGRLTLGSFGRYHLLRLVGVGGMGEVYEAEQDSPRRRVALKVIRVDLLSPEAAARFDNEARILAKLQHPGIAQIYDAGRIVSQGVPLPYFAMEFVDGKPLTDFMRAKNPPLAQRLQLFMAVCEAVEHAHRKGVIHRDLKPGNILVDAAGQPRVLDFGVARLTESDVQATTMRTEVGHLVGTLPYMSPEQISADPDGLDTRSDVYTLGVLLYELLSGRPPYEIDKARLHEAARIIKETEPAPLGTTDRALRGDLQTIVSKALAKERERRYQSVGELAADIRRYLADSPIDARPPSAVYQLRKFARRNRVMVIAASMTAAAILAGGVACGWFALEQWRLVGLLTASRTTEAAQRAEADAKRLDAERSSKTSWEVVQFVGNAIKQASPYHNPSDYTLREFVKSATREIDRTPINDPLTEAAIRSAMGTMLIGVGQPQDARKQQERAVELRRAQLGEKHPLTLQSLTDLGYSMVECGDLNAALDTLGKAREIAIELLGPADLIVLEIESTRATALEHAMRLEESEAATQIALELARQSLPPDHEVIIELSNNMANIWMRVGRQEEARAMLQSLLDADQKKGGSFLSTGIRNSLAVLNTSLGRYKDAEAEARAVLSEVEERAGTKSSFYAAATVNLADALAGQKKWTDAEVAYRSAIDLIGALMGTTHPEVYSCRGRLAEVLANQGRFDEAVAEADGVIPALESSLGPKQPAMLRMMMRIANVYNLAGQLDQAETLYRERWSRSQHNVPPGHPMFLPMNFQHMRAASDLGKFLLEHERYEDAKPILVEGLELCLETKGISPLEPIDARINLAKCLTALHDFETAERTLLTDDGKIPADVEAAPGFLKRRYLRAAVALYEAWQKPERAEELRARVEKESASAPPPAVPGK